MARLKVIGFGPGDEALLTARANEALKAASRVLNTREMPLSELLLALQSPTEGETAVLVSGDCGFSSITKTIVRDFSGLYEIEVVPGIGSIQYLSARLKVPYDDAMLVSLHGRRGDIVAKVSYNKRIFALAGGVNSAEEICRTLCSKGLGDVDVSVGERLSYADERVVTGKACELKDKSFDSLSVLYIENPKAANAHEPLHDSDFTRGSAPMTKEEVRWLSVQKLGICPGDTVFDIGAGTGSVAVEMARRAYDGSVYAIEAKEEACALIRENAARHGAYNVELVCGMAPEALKGLPAPDKAFIGGSSGNMGGILEYLVSLNPGMTVVANAITLQTLHEVTEGYEKQGIATTDVICVNVAKAKSVGGYDMMVAQNPVYVITGGGSCKPGHGTPSSGQCAPSLPGHSAAPMQPGGQLP